jgi:hypothetical protein
MNRGIFWKLDQLLEAALQGWAFSRLFRKLRILDNLKQIENRLSLCESILPVDAKAALHIVRKLLEDLK